LDDTLKRLKALLESQDEFPLVYQLKVIGMNSEEFRLEAASLEKQFVKLKRTTERLSSSQAHLALTLQWEADSADEIIEVYQTAMKLKGLITLI
jgi:putative lipoic acid-binding regulatory protein